MPTPQWQHSRAYQNNGPDYFVVYDIANRGPRNLHGRHVADFHDEADARLAASAPLFAHLLTAILARLDLEAQTTTENFPCRAIRGEIQRALDMAGGAR